MPATVIANPELSQGGIVLIEHSYNADAEGGVIYSAQYACLAQFAEQNSRAFVYRAGPPLPLPDILSGMPIASVPTLFQVTAQRANGLAYFNAQYSTFSLNTFVATESETWKVFSKSRTVKPFRTLNGVNPGFTATLTFEYLSRSVVTRSKGRVVRRAPRNGPWADQPKNPKTVISGSLNNQAFDSATPGGGFAPSYKLEIIETISSTTEINNLETFVLSRAGYYV